MNRIQPPLVRRCPPPPCDDIGRPTVPIDAWCIVTTGKPRPKPVDEWEDAAGKAECRRPS